jgi:phosphohistidine phosphatase
MKTLLILRHAKSDWSDAGQADFDRPLAKRGLNDAPVMGEVLARFDCRPDLVLSSPALRARQTAELAGEACEYQGTIQWEDTFYGGGSRDVIDALRRLPDGVERPLLVGHNPTLEQAASMLVSRSGADWREDSIMRIPAGGLVCLDLNIAAWAELEPGAGVLRWFLIPKLAKAIR